MTTPSPAARDPLTELQRLGQEFDAYDTAAVVGHYLMTNTSVAVEQIVAIEALIREQNSTMRAGEARTELGDRLSDAADEINGAIDAQTYDERIHLGDYPDEHEFYVTLTAKQIRDLNDAICAYQHSAPPVSCITEPIDGMVEAALQACRDARLSTTHPMTFFAMRIAIRAALHEQSSTAEPLPGYESVTLVKGTSVCVAFDNVFHAGRFFKEIQRRGSADGGAR